MPVETPMKCNPHFAVRKAEVQAAGGEVHVVMVVSIADPPVVLKLHAPDELGRFVDALRAVGRAVWGGQD